MPASSIARNGTPAAIRRRSPTTIPMAPTPAAPGSTASTATRPARASAGRTVHFPKSCLHCATPDCVTVCPTGASYKRTEDGIVLVDEDMCIGCGLCAWACPYGARELDRVMGVMKKCTLCIDRIYNENLEEVARVPACVATCPASARHFGDLGDPASAVSRLVAERGGYDLMPEMGYRPTNKYLPPQAAQDRECCDRRAVGARARGAVGRLPRLARQAAQRLGAPLHPAGSVILFTTTSGAGYGLLALLGLLGPAGLVPQDRWFGFAGLGLGAGARHRRPARLDLPSRPSRARLARGQPMALVLAVARGRHGARDLCAGGPLRHRLGLPRAHRAAAGPWRACWRPPAPCSRSAAPA